VVVLVAICYALSGCLWGAELNKAYTRRLGSLKPRRFYEGTRIQLKLSRAYSILLL
jgi:hypothetical protein